MIHSLAPNVCYGSLGLKPYLAKVSQTLHVHVPLDSNKGLQSQFQVIESGFIKLPCRDLFACGPYEVITTVGLQTQDHTDLMPIHHLDIDNLQT